MSLLTGLSYSNPRSSDRSSLISDYVNPEFKSRHLQWLGNLMFFNVEFEIISIWVAPAPSRNAIPWKFPFSLYRQIGLYVWSIIDSSPFCRINRQRDYKNKKYGHGGQKKRSKRNTRDSFGMGLKRDFDPSKHQNAPKKVGRMKAKGGGLKMKHKRSQSKRRRWSLSAILICT